MREFSPQERRAMTAALDALVQQLTAHVPLYHDEAGTWWVPLHPLLDAVTLDARLEPTVLITLHPQTYPLASGTPVLVVPLGEALAVLPFSRHFPEARGYVERLEALQTRTAERAPPSPRGVALQEGTCGEMP